MFLFKKTATFQDHPFNVEVVTVALENFEDQLGITGSVEAERDVTVAAEESGVIRELYVDKGQRVRAGQAIAKIDDRVLRAQYDQAMSEAALARETWDRQKRLWEEDRIGSEMNYLRSRYGAETAEANARVIAARLERTVVRAPITGVLDSRLVEIGSMVAPGAPVAPGGPAGPIGPIGPVAPVAPCGPCGPCGPGGP